MFISFVLIQVKRTKEKVKTPMGYIAFCGSISSYTIHTRNHEDMTKILTLWFLSMVFLCISVADPTISPLFVVIRVSSWLMKIS
ncbi:MAG: hypothetical protein J7K51_08845 [Thermotogae bacterium]|nr:hypothetical protein [Thermotogota bacterium]